jgi:hypothetical protein
MRLGGWSALEESSERANIGIISMGTTKAVLLAEVISLRQAVGASPIMN